MSEPAKNIIPAYRQVAIADHGGGGRLMPQTFGDVVSFSEIMARSQHAIPKHLRDVPGACLAVTMQAMRWEMDPFAVASKSYNVKDLIAYEAQLIAAVVHTRAPLKSRPQYAYTGEGQDRRCTVSAEFDDGVVRKYESPRLADIKTKNSPLWVADVDQQLGYYSIRAFARRYCPEVILGVYTPEEAESFRGPDNAVDITPRVPLAGRLAAPKNENGFSEQRVISEVDGASSSQPFPSSVIDSPEPETQPAPDAPPVSSGAGTNSAPATRNRAVDSDGHTDAGEGGQVAGPSNPALTHPSPAPGGLPSDWPQRYADALRLAPKPASLLKLAAKFWAQYGGWDKHKAGPDAETAIAIYDVFAIITDAVERDAQLRELGAVV